MTQQAQDYFKIFGDFKAPSVDLSQAVDASRRNIEAFTSASQVFASSAQAIGRRQAEAFRNHVEKSLAAARDIAQGSGSPETSAARGVDYARSVFEDTLGHFREVSEIVVKSGNEALQTLNRRAVASFEELSQHSAPKAKRKSA